MYVCTCVCVCMSVRVCVFGYYSVVVPHCHLQEETQLLTSLDATQNFCLFLLEITVVPTHHRDALIEQLMREVVELKEKIIELEGQRDADHELMTGLRERLQMLESELGDYKEIAEQTCNENVLLKKQIEASKTEQGAQAEAEGR